jgi:hypothetical protein
MQQNLESLTERFSTTVQNLESLTDINICNQIRKKVLEHLETTGKKINRSGVLNGLQRAQYKVDLKQYSNGNNTQIINNASEYFRTCFGIGPRFMETNELYDEYSFLCGIFYDMNKGSIIIEGMLCVKS